MVLATDPVYARHARTVADDGWTAAQQGRRADCDTRCVPRVMEDPLWHTRVKLILHHPDAHHQSGLCDRPKTKLANGPLRIDFLADAITARDRDGAWSEPWLPPKERDLVCYLGSYVGRTVPHTELLIQLWGDAYHDERHILRVTLSRARDGLRRVNPDAAALIVTETCRGYRMVDRRDDDGQAP